MRVSRVVSASGISRAFVPPCIPGASCAPLDCVSRTSADRSAGTLGAHSGCEFLQELCRARVAARGRLVSAHHGATRLHQTNARASTRARTRSSTQRVRRALDGATRVAGCSRVVQALHLALVRHVVGRRDTRRRALVGRPAARRGAAAHGAAATTPTSRRCSTAASSRSSATTWRTRSRRSTPRT